MNHISAVCRSSRQAVNKLEECGDKQNNMANTDILHSNAKSSGIIAKLKTSSFHDSIKFHIKYTSSKNNMLLFCIFKTLFTRSANKLLSQTKNKNAKNAYNVV